MFECWNFCTYWAHFLGYHNRSLDNCLTLNILAIAYMNSETFPWKYCNCCTPSGFPHPQWAPDLTSEYFMHRSTRLLAGETHYFILSLFHLNAEYDWLTYWNHRHRVIYGVESWNGVVEWSGVEFGVEWSLLYNHVICVLEFGVELGNTY